MKKVIFAFLFFNLAFTIFSQPCIWNIDKLNREKESPTVASRLIMKEANRQLSIVISSVMDKELTPPSGDKHDYWSMGRYWWPDPQKKDGLPYIRRDGLVNKEIDKLDRAPMSMMSKSVTVLSLAYYLTGNEDYAAKAVQNLRIWFVNSDTRMNPNMNFGQTILGRNEGRGRGEGLIDSYAFVEMLDGLELLKESSRFKKSDQAAMKSWFSDYLQWMLTSPIANEEYEAKNNHGTAFDVQVVRYATYVGRTDVALRFINEFSNRRLFAQIEPDGSQPLELARTTALGYSIFNLTHILDMCVMAKGVTGVDLFNKVSSDGRSVDKALAYLANFAGKPSSEFPYKQIKEWDKVQKELSWLLYRADKLSKKSKYLSLYSAELLSGGKAVESLLY
ncbi:MAG: alginate lyase family protein [Bacteroidales bacterium]